MIHQIFSVRPFNIDKPTQLTVDKFLEIANRKDNWYTHQYFFSCYQQELSNYGKEKTIPVGYYLPLKLVNHLITAPKLLTSIKETKMGKTPLLAMVIDMIFAVLCYQPLLDTFIDFLEAFEGTSHFYDTV